MSAYNAAHQRAIDNQSEPDRDEDDAPVAEAWIDPLVLLRQTRRYHRLPYYARAKSRALGVCVGMSQLRMIESAIRCDLACRDAVAAWRLAA